MKWQLVAAVPPNEFLFAVFESQHCLHNFSVPASAQQSLCLNKLYCIILLPTCCATCWTTDHQDPTRMRPYTRFNCLDNQDPTRYPNHCCLHSPGQQELPGVHQQLPQCQQPTMYALSTWQDTSTRLPVQTAHGGLIQAVVPLNTVAGLTLLYQHKHTLLQEHMVQHHSSVSVQGSCRTAIAGVAQGLAT